MPDPSNIFILAIITLSAGLLFGLWQLRRVRKAERGEDPIDTGD
jgi:hypothetical protein